MKLWMISKTAIRFFVVEAGDYYLTPAFISWDGRQGEVLGFVVLGPSEHFLFGYRLFLWPLTISVAMPRFL